MEIAIFPQLGVQVLGDSVAEPIHFCAAPAPACQKFRLRLRPFSPYILEKIQKFPWFKIFFILLTQKMIIKRFFKVNM
jgi:hypothetical protein